MTIFEQINQGIKEAMLKREQLRLDVLRMLKSKVMAVEARGNVPDPDVIKLFKTYYGNIQESLQTARPDMVEKLQAELAIIQEFLPKVPSPEETKKLITQAIADSGAKSKKDLGLVMKAVMKLNSAVDGKLAKELADQLLP